MMKFAVTILGNNSAVPTNERYPTSQVVTIDDQLFMIDCGEGTQLQLSRYKIKRNRIEHIFISHLHGDHYFGLIGLINSYSLMHRIQPLTVYGPPALEEIINLQLECAHANLPYELNFHPIEAGEHEVLLQTEHLEVSCFPTSHRIACHGFLFKEKNILRHILPEAVKAYNVPTYYYSQLQQGQDYINKAGETIKNEWLTRSSERGRSYAFCADTKYDEALIPYIQDASMIYHETTYLKDKAEKAASRFHSTTQEAATMAQKASVGKLLIGHYSSSYKDLTPFAEEAKEIFPNTELSEEGATYLIENE